MFGFDTDLYVTEVFFTSLLVQATRAMTAGVTDYRRRQPSYRRSFLLAYAHRIGERLEAATTYAAEAMADDRLLPVLDRRRSEVDDAVHEAFPQLEHKRVSASNGWGWAEGMAAADRADLAALDELRAS